MPIYFNFNFSTCIRKRLLRKEVVVRADLDGATFAEGALHASVKKSETISVHHLLLSLADSLATIDVRF